MTESTPLLVEISARAIGCKIPQPIAHTEIQTILVTQQDCATISKSTQTAKNDMQRR